MSRRSRSALAGRAIALASIAALATLATACARRPAADPGMAGTGRPDSTRPMLDSVAAGYVRLVLAVGAHDANYVDAYYGDPAWRTAAESSKRPLADVRRDATALLASLGEGSTAHGDAMVALRHAYLQKQLASLVAYVDILGGARPRFDDESRALYDATAPTRPESHFREVLARLDRALPGAGTVQERYAAFTAGFVIPAARVDTVFRAAVAECRARTARHVTLPAGERFSIEYVTGKPWSGYNWYQGGLRSVIQVNTDLPIAIDRAVDLACHEGYPGHHVYNALLEQRLVRERGWIEYSVYPLFSPQSLIAEGSANYGVRMAFPGTERVRWEREVLFPLAGLDASRAERYYEVAGMVTALGHAGNEAARRYLNGEIDGAAAARWLETYALMTPGAAQRRIRFFDTYRSYVINYNHGQDLVGAWVERTGGTSEADRWRAFEALLSSPRLPSGLQ